MRGHRHRHRHEQLRICLIILQIPAVVILLQLVLQQQQEQHDDNQLLVSCTRPPAAAVQHHRHQYEAVAAAAAIEESTDYEWKLAISPWHMIDADAKQQEIGVKQQDSSSSSSLSSSLSSSSLSSSSSSSLSSSLSSSSSKDKSTGSISGSAYRDQYPRYRRDLQIAPISDSNATIPALFVFGDSLSDTGNGPFVNHTTACSLPYGETFPGYGDCRFSDGRTILCDFLAGHLGLRPVNPWLDVFLDFDEGANYAIPGATVLPDFMPLGLSQQIEWHLDLVDQVRNRTTTKYHSSSSPAVASVLASTSLSTASAAREDYTSSSSGLIHDARKRLPRPESLRDALYALHIGGLDYKLSYIDESLPPEYVNASLVPQVVAGLRDALETLYERAGARRLVVMGVGAQGCLSSVLGRFLELERDSSGCVVAINSITRNSAQQTLAMMRELAQLRPDASYTFVDLHSATLHIVDHAHAFGFWEPYNICCGAGPGYPYGRSPSILCSNTTESLYVCPDPISFINWDGLHFTDSFNFQVFNHTFLTGAFAYSIPSSDSMPSIMIV